MLLFLINSPALIGPQNLVLSIALPCPTAPLSGGFYLLAWALTGHRGFQAFSWLFEHNQVCRPFQLSGSGIPQAFVSLNSCLWQVSMCSRNISCFSSHIFFKSSYLHFGKQLVRNLKTYFFFLSWAIVAGRSLVSSRPTWSSKWVPV